MKKIVIKLGGSVITKKDVKDFPMNIEDIKRNADDYIRREDVERLGREISEATGESNCQLILINGVGPFGHFLVSKKQPLELVHKSVEFLNEKLIEYLDNELKIESVAPFDTCKYGNGNFDVVNLWKECERILNSGKIFSIYGDMLEGYKVISGDDLAVILAEMWGADKIIMTLDVDGVFDKHPSKKDARLIKKLTGSEKIKFEEGTIDVTGGLKEKIRKLQSCRIKSQIINGLVNGNLKRAMLGDESIGTIISKS